jgi:hypothetical protein
VALVEVPQALAQTAGDRGARHLLELAEAILAMSGVECVWINQRRSPMLVYVFQRPESVEDGAKLCQTHLKFGAYTRASRRRACSFSVSASGAPRSASGWKRPVCCTCRWWRSYGPTGTLPPS